jgi:hypothetical protein
LIIATGYPRPVFSAYASLTVRAFCEAGESAYPSVSLQPQVYLEEWHGAVFIIPGVYIFGMCFVLGPCFGRSGWLLLTALSGDRSCDQN